MTLLSCWGSIHPAYGNIHDPGPEFLPLWLGIVLGAMSIGLILKATGQKEGLRMMRELLAEKIRWGKVLSVRIVLFLYGYHNGLHCLPHRTIPFHGFSFVVY